MNPVRGLTFACLLAVTASTVPSEAQVKTPLSASTPLADRLAVQSLSVSPTHPYNFAFVVKNVSDTLLSAVDLKVTRDGALVVGSAVVQSLAPGATTELRGTATPGMPLAPGSYTLTAKARVTGTSLVEGFTRNNEQSAAFTVPAPSPAPYVVRARLDPNEAKKAGALFAAVPVPEIGTPIPTITLDRTRTLQTSQCTPVVASPLPPAPCKTSAVFSAYRGFKLKNGWKVVSYTTSHSSGVGGWSWAPPKGDDPSYEMIIWQSASIMPNLSDSVSVEIVIEGPAGTNPYR